MSNWMTFDQGLMPPMGDPNPIVGFPVMSKQLAILTADLQVRIGRWHVNGQVYLYDEGKETIVFTPAIGEYRKMSAPFRAIAWCPWSEIAAELARQAQTDEAADARIASWRDTDNGR